MVSQVVKIKNPLGLHVRPAGILVKAADRCDSQIELLKKNCIINCKSLLNIVSGDIRCGDEVTLRCTGEHEKEDLAYMVNVIENELE